MIDNHQNNSNTNTDTIPSNLSERERLKQEIETHRVQTSEKSKRLNQLDLEEWKPSFNNLLESIKSTRRFPESITGDEKSSMFITLRNELMGVFSIPTIEPTGNKMGKVTSEDRYRILKLHEKGMSKWDISREMKRTTETVDKIIKEGVETV